MTPICSPDLSIAASLAISSNSGLSSIISSEVLYLKFRTCIFSSKSNPELLSTIFFFILLSEVVDQAELLLL